MDKETILSYIYCILPILISVLLLTIPSLIYAKIAKYINHFYETERVNGLRRSPAMVCLVVILVLVFCVSGGYGVWKIIEYITAEPELVLFAPIVPIHMQIMEEVESYTSAFSLALSVASLFSLAICEIAWRKENKKKEECPLEA